MVLEVDVAGAAGHREAHRPEMPVETDRGVEGAVELKMRAGKHHQVRHDQAERGDVEAIVAAFESHPAGRGIE